MISVETFVGFVRKKDLGRIKFALREMHFNLDTVDENGRTVLHHAVLEGIIKDDLQMTNHLLAFGADVNIRDETANRESPLHIALRYDRLDFVRALLTSPTFDVIKYDSFIKQIFPAVAKQQSQHHSSSSSTTSHQYHAHSCFSLPGSDLTNSPSSTSSWKRRDVINSSVSSIDSCCTTDSVVTQIERCCLDNSKSNEGLLANQHSNTLRSLSNQSCPHSSGQFEWMNEVTRSCLLLVRQNVAHYVDSLQPPVINQICECCCAICCSSPEHHQQHLLLQQQQPQQPQQPQHFPVHQHDSQASVNCCCCSYLFNNDITMTSTTTTSNRNSNTDFTDVIVLQDESNFTPFTEFLKRSSNPARLQHLLIVDCRLQWDSQDEPFLVNQDQQQQQQQQNYDSPCRSHSSKSEQQPQQPPPPHYQPVSHDQQILQQILQQQPYLLTTLILSHTHLKRLPVQIFNMAATLEVLKVDRNCLEEISDEITKLKKLKVFSCDCQKPRLRYMNRSFGSMTALQVLSVSGNKLDDISWITPLVNLKFLKCDRNRITALPKELSNFKELQVLDISYNRITDIPTSLNDLISRLYRFDYFNVTLRPKYLRTDLLQLQKRTDLQCFIRQSTGRSSVLDISVGVVGETQSGKSTLVEYLNKDSHETISSSSSSLSSWIFSSYYSTSADNNTCYNFGVPGNKSSDMLLYHSTDGSNNGSNNVYSTKQQPALPTFVSAVELNRGWSDGYSTRINIDVFILSIDISTIQPNNNCHQHLYQRHLYRFQMWLESLYETHPNTPVIIAGTHADNVKNSSYHDIWQAVEKILDKGRKFHNKRYHGDQKMRSCLLCNKPSFHKTARRTFSKGRSTGGMLGFVDGSSSDKQDTSSAFTPADLGGKKSSSSATLISTTSGDSCVKKSQPSPPPPFGSRNKFPHVIAYYEVDARKIASKLTKQKSLSSSSGLQSSGSNPNLALLECYSAERLKQAIVCLCMEFSGGSRVPRSWIKFLIKLNSLENNLRLPFTSYEEVKTLAKTCDVPLNQLKQMLTYFDSKGKLIYFGSETDEQLSRLVVGNVAWFLGRVQHLLETLDRSHCTENEVINILNDKELNSIATNLPKKSATYKYKLVKSSNLAQTSVMNSSYARWLLLALIKLETCLVVPDSLTTPILTNPYCVFFNGSNSFETRKHQQFEIPSLKPQPSLNEPRNLIVVPLLEHGFPSLDVWPDNPEWEERQISCEISLRLLKPGFFTDLMVRLNDEEGRKTLKVIPDPTPVFMAHHVVFFSSLDESGCEDCYINRKKLKLCMPDSDSHHNDNRDDLKFDESLHKVHLSLHPRMEFIRVQVRGTTPCCPTKAVLNFIENYLDDQPEEDFEHANVVNNDTASSFSSSHTPSSSMSPSTSILYSSDGLGSFGSLSHGGCITGSRDDEDDDRYGDMFLTCSKCVMLKNSQAGRVSYCRISSKRRNNNTTISCNKRWNNMNTATWNKCRSSEYQLNVSGGCSAGCGVDIPASTAVEVPATVSLTVLPDYEHPRLVIILPPSATVTTRDWYLFSKTGFLEGLEVHFLCEYTSHWHFTDDVGYRINRSAHFSKFSGGEQLSRLVTLALPLVQAIHGIPEHPCNVRLIAPIIPTLIKNYEYLRSGEFGQHHHNNQGHVIDPVAWLLKNKERVLTMLSKVLTAAGDGMSDLYFKVNNPVNAYTIFQSASTSSRMMLCRYLRIDNSSSRFGSLRPLYVDREIRWLCKEHYCEIKSTMN